MNSERAIRIPFCSFLAVLSGVVTGVGADITTNLTSIADSSIHVFSPDSNFGTDFTMAAGDTSTTGNNEVRRALVAFNLAGNIPPGATITSASLQLTVTKAPALAANSTFDLRRLLKPWDELSVTWNSASTGTTWEQAGATGASDSASSASSTVFVSGVGTY